MKMDTSIPHLEVYTEGLFCDREVVAVKLIMYNGKSVCGFPEKFTLDFRCTQLQPAPSHQPHKIRMNENICRKMQREMVNALIEAVEDTGLSYEPHYRDIVTGAPVEIQMPVMDGLAHK